MTTRGVTYRGGGQPASRLRFEGRSCLIAIVTASATAATPMIALAQQATTLNGPPVQVAPYALEPGVPNIVIPTGTPTPLANGSGTDGSGSGGDSSSGSDALNTMLGTPWGAQATANAQALGVNASALAATCVLESGCQNVIGSGAQGVFQMFSTAYQEGLQTALTANPQLASQIVPGSAGMNDPVTEAIAASGYLMQANQTLQADGISNPTVMDARAYYQFGPTYGPQVAQASSSMTMSSLLPASWLASNGISPTETVAQWQASVQSKIGSAAGQTVLS